MTGWLQRPRARAGALESCRRWKPPPPTPPERRPACAGRVTSLDRLGDRALYGLTAAAAMLRAAHHRRRSSGRSSRARGRRSSTSGSASSGTAAGTRVTEVFGARAFIIGTLVTSFGAMLLAAPLSIAIGLFLSELAPPAIRGPIGSLIEMLAAVPSVVIGLWGIFVLGPFMRAARRAVPARLLRLDPDLRRPPPQSGVLAGDRRADDHDRSRSPRRSAASSSSASRATSKEASIGLGATRWEMVRGVVVPYVQGGVVAGDHARPRPRARRGDRGHAGDRQQLQPLQLSLFAPGNTLASQLAKQLPERADERSQIASLALPRR